MEEITQKNILMICSWIDIEKNMGVFFWEQAAAMDNDFKMQLCNFNKIKTSNIFKLSQKIIKKKTTPNGIDVYFVDYLHFSFLSKKMNILIFKYYVKNFHSFLKNNNIKIDLIHAQSIFNAGIEAYYFNKLTKIPYIFTEHNQFSLREKSRKEIKIISKILNSPYPNLVVSYDKIRQFATNSFFSKFEVVGNSVDEKIFYYKKTKKENEQFTITTVGAFNPIKDQETILKALHQLDKNPSYKIKFNWIGFDSWGTDYQDEINRIISLYDFKNIKIELTPHLSRNELASKLRESDLFLFSSICEGMPVSMLEALSCGVPVCTTRCGGVDEIINKDNGEIIQIMDYNAMSNFILKNINKEIIFDNENISKNILNNYSNDAFSKRLKEIYLRALNIKNYK
ncbi:MAG: glycosyltransferase family 4 protein [Flavobacterium sp.]